MAPSDNISLDNIISQITTSNNGPALRHTIRQYPRDILEPILASSLGSGQDPLDVLDSRVNTIGMAYILSARLSVQGAPPPNWNRILDFCRNFDPESARLVPERMTMLAKGMVRYASESIGSKQVIAPLSDLVRRYPPTPSHLSTIHPIFVLACISSGYFSAAIPVLSHPITSIDTNINDLHYNDALTYHYTGAIAFGALKRWAEAEDFFEICISIPGYPSALQLEAVKKLRLVQLIWKGKISPLPKYASQTLSKQFKNSPYQAFVNAYPHNRQALKEILDKERALFTVERNGGLLQQAFLRAPRWAIKKLTATYVTLSLADIGREVGMDSEEEVRALLLSMIESNDISAQLTASGTVTFSDPPPQFTRAQIDQVLLDVQRQAAGLGALDGEIGRGKEFLSKALKSREDSAWAPSQDEEMYQMSGGNQWEVETIFS